MRTVHSNKKSDICQQHEKPLDLSFLYLQTAYKIILGDKVFSWLLQSTPKTVKSISHTVWVTKNISPMGSINSKVIFYIHSDYEDDWRNMVWDFCLLCLLLASCHTILKFQNFKKFQVFNNFKFFKNFKIFKNFEFSKNFKVSNFQSFFCDGCCDKFSVLQWQPVQVSCGTVSVLVRPHEWTVLWLVSILHRDWPQKLIKLKQSPKVLQSAYQFCPDIEEKYLFYVD